MERAKSFVASRSTASSNRFKVEKTTAAGGVSEAVVNGKNGKFKRSNSLIGAGDPALLANLENIEPGKIFRNQDLHELR